MLMIKLYNVNQLYFHFVLLLMKLIFKLIIKLLCKLFNLYFNYQNIQILILLLKHHYKCLQNLQCN